jgi:hypothetical protein
MRLKQALEGKKFDLRVLDKHLGEKKITQAEFDSYLKDLPDDSSSMTTTGEVEQKRRAQRGGGNTEGSFE